MGRGKGGVGWDGVGVWLEWCVDGISRGKPYMRKGVHAACFPRPGPPRCPACTHRLRSVVWCMGRGVLGAGAGQYPGEKEITFPPFTCLEADGDPRVERNQAGEIVVFPLKVTLP